MGEHHGSTDHKDTQIDRHSQSNQGEKIININIAFLYFPPFLIFVHITYILHFFYFILFNKHRLPNSKLIRFVQRGNAINVPPNYIFFVSTTPFPASSDSHLFSLFAHHSHINYSVFLNSIQHNNSAATTDYRHRPMLIIRMIVMWCEVKWCWRYEWWRIVAVAPTSLSFQSFIS